MIRTCTAGPAGIVMTRNIGAWADHDQGIKKNVVGLHCSITSYSKRDAFGIVLLEPLIGKFCRREHLEVIDVANLLVRIDVNPNGFSNPGGAPDAAAVHPAAPRPAAARTGGAG
jgi:hypothetical protein